MSSFFIACNLAAGEQNYDAVRDAIRSLGTWHQFQDALFYVNTHSSPTQVYDIVMASMDTGDSLAVINAHAGIVTDWDRPTGAEACATWITQPGRTVTGRSRNGSSSP